MWHFDLNVVLSCVEIATLQTVLGQGTPSQYADVTAAGKTYTIDRSELSDEHLHATSRSGDHLCVATEGDYVIVAVAESHKGRDCQNAVHDVLENLHKKTLEDKTQSTTSSKMYVMPNTWSDSFHNAALEDKTETGYLTPTSLSQS